MIVIETCPKCGSDIMDTIICTYPPIPHKQCTNPNCDWSWTGEREEIKRVPFYDDPELLEESK